MALGCTGWSIVCMVTLQDEWSSNLILPIGRSPSTPHGIYDGHTLSGVVDTTKKLTGSAIEDAYVDKCNRGHDTANPHSIFISGQRRGIFGIIKRELRRRSAIEAVIGHMKMDGHLGRCYLKGREGDATNAILSAIGCNFRLVLAWLRILLSLILLALSRAFCRSRGNWR